MISLLVEIGTGGLAGAADYTPASAVRELYARLPNPKRASRFRCR